MVVHAFASLQFSITPLLSTGLDLWASAGRAEHEVQPVAGADADDAIGLGALAEEQLALIAENGLHGIPFFWVVGWSVSLTVAAGAAAQMHDDQEYVDEDVSVGDVVFHGPPWLMMRKLAEGVGNAPTSV